MIPKNKLLALFDARFDYASARIVLADVLAKAGVSLDKEGLEPGDVRRVTGALAGMGIPRVDALVAGLGALTEGAPAGKGKAGAMTQSDAVPDTMPDTMPRAVPEAETPAEQVEEPAEDAQAAEDVETEAAKARPAKGKKR